MIFSSCPPDPTIRCVSPAFYAVIGAAAMLGGVTRMTGELISSFRLVHCVHVPSRTVSLVVIMFELTGALSHVLPIMISVVVSKWVADALGKDGVYAVWIAMRQYPWLPQTDYRDKGQTAAQIMKPVHDLVVIREELTMTAGELLAFVKQHAFHGFPVVDGEMLIGFVVKEKLRAHLGMGESAISPLREQLKNCCRVLGYG
jgi:chloride channel 3/4/5